METSDPTQNTACSRDRSNRAFAEIRDGKLLGKRQLLALQAFVECGTATANEAYRYTVDRLNAPLSGNGLGSRPSELVQMGVLVVCGERRCTVTKRVACVFACTGGLPTKLEREVGPRKPLHLYYDQNGVLQAVRCELMDDPPDDWCVVTTAVVRRNGKAAISGPIPPQLLDYQRPAHRSRAHGVDEQNFLLGLSAGPAA